MTEPVEIVRPDLNPGWLERAIGFLSPSWAMNRAAARAAAEELSGYRGGYRGRLDDSGPAYGRADFHLDVTRDRWSIISRARALERSNVIAEGLLSRATENVVGCGYRLQAQSSSSAWNANVEARFKEWAEFEADVRGLSTLNELLALTYRSWLRDGDVGCLLLADGKLQHLESDQIASPTGGIPTRNEIDGIVMDSRGRPKSYLVITDPDPEMSSVRFGNPFIEVPAKEVLFLARRQRHGQTRGLSALATVAWLLEQIDGQIEAVVVASRMAACFGLVLQRAGRMSGLPTTTDGDGNSRRKLRMEPGMVFETAPGDTISQVNPAQPSQNFPEFVTTLSRMVGLAFGLPLEVAFLDFSRTNYSSARAALLQAQQVWRGHQDMLKRHQSKIYRWWLMREIEAGTIPARRDALTHTWITPGWRWVDPEKELRAHLGAVDAGLATLSDIAMQQGLDFEDLVTRRRRELDMLEDAGIPLVRSTLTRDVVESTPGEPGGPGPAPEAEDEDEDSDDGEE